MNGPTRIQAEALPIHPGRLSRDLFPTANTEPLAEYSPDQVEVSGRIGISAGEKLPLRFFVRDSPLGEWAAWITSLRFVNNDGKSSTCSVASVG